jgi:DNA-binding NtrC family response regulator
MKNDTYPSVLVVEDEGLVALLLKEVLKELGLQPHVFTEAKPALATIDSTPYTAAVLDLCLPDLNGDHIVKALLARDPKFRIVLTTGQDPQEVEDRYAYAPRVRVLSKPFDIRMLEDELEGLGIVTQVHRAPPRIFENDFADARMTA